MKIKQLTDLMNDHGTIPRIRVLKHLPDYTVMKYEGKVQNMSDEIAQMKVNSFTALGTGFLEIHTQ